MSGRRVQRLNSLLKEVISDVIRRRVKNPHVSQFVTVTGVEVTPDLHYAKVHVSIMGEKEERSSTLKALQSAASFIAVRASKEVTMRFFPSLTFHLDDSLDTHMRIDSILNELKTERTDRGTTEALDDDAD